MYASLAGLMVLTSQKITLRPLIYAGLIVYSISIGLLYQNKNIVPDIRYWSLGLVCSYLFTMPVVIREIVNIKNYLLNAVLVTEVLLAISLYMFPGLLGFPGYGLGVPAYLFAYYLARANYYLATVAFVLTVLQAKRGFILAVTILLLVYLYAKNKRLFMWAFFIAFAWGLVFIDDFQELHSFLALFRLDLNISGEFADFAQSASLGRVNEFLETFSLIEGGQWFTGLGIGYEFERIAYNGEFRGLTGYTHSTPYNFYITGGLLGIAFFVVCSLKSFSRSISVGREYKKYEPLYISIIAFVSCFFSFWSAVSPWFWVFMAFGATSTYVYSPLNPQSKVG